MSRILPVLTLLVVAAAASGCLREPLRGDDAASTCQADLRPAQVPQGAPSAGGSGPRALEVTVLGEDGAALAGAAVTAWWAGQANGTAEVVRLRTDASGLARVGAPVGVAVGLLAGAEEGGSWTHDTHVAAAAQPAEVLLLPLGVRGEAAGTWREPASAGFLPGGERWMPLPLPWADDAHVARLTSLRLELSWQNGPGGGADFGIAAASGAQTFHYVNGEYQATPGSHTEARTLDAGEVARLGWGNGTPAQAGPSVSTGSFASTGIPFTLAWQASFRPDPHAGDVCRALGPVRAVDVTSGDAA